MQTKLRTPKSPEEQALLHELAVAGSSDRAKLLSFLCEQAPPPSGDAPPLPDELRQRLEEKFSPHPKPKRQMQPAQQQGVLHQIADWFKETFAARPLAFGGGLAMAACVVLLAILNFGPPREKSTNPMDTIRGGAGTDSVAMSSGIQWYWLGNADAALQNQMTSLLGISSFQSAATLDETPAVQGFASIIAIDPQFGAWLKKSAGEPQPFAAEGVPGSADWAAMLKKATEAATEAARQ